MESHVNTERCVSHLEKNGLGHIMGHPSHLMGQRGQACVIGVIDYSLCKGQKHR